jgi:hypothetical protein
MGSDWPSFDVNDSCKSMCIGYLILMMPSDSDLEQACALHQGMLRLTDASREAHVCFTLSSLSLVIGVSTCTPCRAGTYSGSTGLYLCAGSGLVKSGEIEVAGQYKVQKASGGILLR